ncbi:MAG: AAA family ATPase [Lachnospiraceae bacterium]|nr:AAA family ATPase [Lachnospiraceae bacterium]
MNSYGNEKKKKLPIGAEYFDDIVRDNYYYVDKTGLILEILSGGSKVHLFTRPRRFGKTLNMSMLRSFFEIGAEKKLFSDTNVGRNKEICDQFLGKYPVVFISLKGIEGMDFEEAKNDLKALINLTAMEFSFLKNSERLEEEEKVAYQNLINTESTMSDSFLKQSLRFLSMLLEKHYGRKVILLIDEYDVPLDKAFQNGYYDEMVLLLRGILGNVLKTNPSLWFAVLTGCLRISKESIFTGLNNLDVHSIVDTKYAQYFGFTEEEVCNLLRYYNREEKLPFLKEWYDGYHFGDVDVYCPWDVMKYVDALMENPQAVPQNYWSNTSGNALLKRMLGRASQKTKAELEMLIAGEAVTKKIHYDLTYNELDRTVDHIWSVLFHTGYLTQDMRGNLVIPNREIKSLFIDQISQWFDDMVKEDHTGRRKLYDAVLNKDFSCIEELLNGYLKKTISIRDTGVRNSMKENFYHGILLGIFGCQDEWIVKSNPEAGDGYADIFIIVPEQDTGIVIEVKYAHNGNLNQAADAALKQIEKNHYEDEMYDIETVLPYGIAFYKKRCKVKTI